MIEPARSLARGATHERGQALTFVAVALVLVFALAGMAVDVGWALQVRRELQASTDAAALAGAGELPDALAAIATANAYSSVSGGKNRRANHPAVSMASGYPQTRCLTSTGLACAPANAIVVRQQSDVPVFFARVLGRTSLRMTTTATASMKGGVPQPLDAMLVLDTTASMNNGCTATVPGIPSPSRLDCALSGARALLSGLWPCSQGVSNCDAARAIDKVGLMVFPGLKLSSSVSLEYDCANNVGASHIAGYARSPIYLVTPLSHDFRTSNTSGLNGANSNLVKSVDWGSGNGCASSAYGVESPGGVGTYFADVINRAQAELAATGRPNAQDVIIILGDGDATYSGVSNPCRRAITAAQNATAQGTWVYSIAYGAPKSSWGSCTHDTPAISALSTMQQLASDAGRFYNQPAAGDLTNIFQRIVLSLTSTRLVSDSTQ